MHYIVVGLGYGDEGKGATVDRLCNDHQVNAVIRYSGGAQAAHNVVVENVHHTFSQFGSGTLSGVPTILEEPFLLDPAHLFDEAKQLSEKTGRSVEDLLANVFVHQNAKVVTPFHAMVNAVRNTSKENGTTGFGIGETRFYDLAVQMGARKGDIVGNYICPSDAPGPSSVLRVVDLKNRPAIRTILRDIAEFYKPMLGEIGDDLIDQYVSGMYGIGQMFQTFQAIDYQASGNWVWEGSQGILLDQTHGTHPHTTWSSVGPEVPLQILRRGGVLRDEIKVVGVTRTYHTRHGNGPLKEEWIGNPPREKHNRDDEMPGAFRVAPFDLRTFSKALKIVNPDEIAITHADINVGAILSHEVFTGLENRELLGLIMMEAYVPVMYLSNGPDRYDLTTINECATIV